MKEVTDLFNAYRECCRHLWNNWFIPTRPDWDQSDRFQDIASLLFSSIILTQIGTDGNSLSPDYEASPKVLSEFHIVPISEYGIPININREKERSGYWDYPLERICPGEADIRFIKFFDFDSLGFRDFSYYQVRITGSEKYPDIVGKDALIETAHAKIFYNQCDV